MPYELNKADIIDFANSVNADTRKDGAELFFKECPYCHGGENKDLRTFSINTETGLFKCFRASCGEQGHFVKLCRDFNYRLDFGSDGQKKEYRRLAQKKEVTIREPAVSYMASRGISREICERYKITTQQANSNLIVFPFYDGEGNLQFVKYRYIKPPEGKGKEFCEKGAMPILFGMEQCTSFERLVITEGQIDSLSLAECGIENAVSVPTGAAGMTWIENCWDWLMKFDELLIMGDCERGKITLVEKIAERVPKPIKVVQLEDYLGEKDANDILRKYGKQAVIDAVNRSKELIVSHIKELADVKSVDLFGMERIYTRIDEVDRLLGGLYFGQLVLLTGKRGEGKSTLMSQIIADALDQGIKTLAYSGELTDYHFKRWLDFQLAGVDNIETYQNRFGDDCYKIPDDVEHKISEWYRGMAYIYDNNSIDADNAGECDSLLQTIEKAIQRHGIRFVCLDNLMTALDVDLDKDLYRAQSSFVKRLKHIAIRYNVVILLVAHPRKSRAGEPLSIDDVSGSGDITNRVDVSMTYSRDASLSNENNGISVGMLSIDKNRLTGAITRGENAISLAYSAKSKRICSTTITSRRVYGWEKAPALEWQEGGDLPF